MLDEAVARQQVGERRGRLGGERAEVDRGPGPVLRRSGDPQEGVRVLLDQLLAVDRADGVVGGRDDGFGVLGAHEPAREGADHVGQSDNPPESARTADADETGPMPDLAATTVVDQGAYDRTVERFQQAEILLPTFAELADPSTIPAAVTTELTHVGADDAHPLNLFRVHWYNAADRTSRTEVPGHLVIPPELSGVDARIVLLLGDRFPMITAHKVLAAYACLAPRLVTGQFDPTEHRAVWPSNEDRELCAWRHRHLAADAVPRRGGAARGDERRTLRVARPLGRRPRRHRAHPRVGVEREGDLRRLRRAGRQPDQRHPQPVLGVREPSRPRDGDRPGDGRRVRDPRGRRTRAAPRRLRVGHRVGGDDRRR